MYLRKQKRRVHLGNQRASEQADRVWFDLFGNHIYPEYQQDGGGGGNTSPALERYIDQFGYGQFPDLKVDGITTANPANTAASDSDLSMYGYTPASQQFPTDGFLVDPAEIAASGTGISAGVNTAVAAANNATAQAASVIPTWMWWALGASVLAVVMSGD